jgi:uncharacterized protein (TIGR02246 family)
VTGLLAVFTLFARVATAAPTLECRAEAPAVRAVRAVAEGIVAADNRRDLERVLAYYTDDAVLMPPGEGPVVGRANILPRYEALFEAFDPEIQIEVHEACVDGGLGFVRGRNGGRLLPRSAGEVRRLDDGFLMLLRASHGAWRISHLIWHRQGPAPTPD